MPSTFDNTITVEMKLPALVFTSKSAFRRSTNCDAAALLALDIHLIYS
jgi:hypothetical protein